MILALDLGEKTGYALSSLPRFSSGVINLKQNKNHPNKYKSFKNFLEKIYLENPSIIKIVYEDVKRHSSTMSAHVWGGYRSILEVFCYDNNLTLIPINVTIIKKLFTGHGNASKDLIIRRCESLGFFGKDHNEADALAILHVFLSYK